MSALLPYFKTYDIRGTVPDQINPEVAYRIGRAVRAWGGAEEIVLGRDARLSSPALAESLIRGLLEAGVNVRDLGLATTPMLNFAVARRRLYGLMITASHNPKHYNGIKFIDRNVEQVYYGRGLERLEQLVLSADSRATAAGGSVVIDDILAEYHDHLLARFDNLDLSARSVVIDCSNGVGALPLGVLERLGVRHRLLYHVPDGDFPNHGPDTLRPENVDALRKTVIAEKADLGLMFDGDADRITFVDERGEIVPPDLVLILLARQELARRPGTVLYDLRFSRAVAEEIEKLGGKSVMMRVGNPFHKQALHQSEDGLLAAELSGHIMYRAHYGIDDPLYAALKLMLALCRTKQSLSEQIGPFRRYAKSGEIRIETEAPESLIALAKTRFSNGEIQEIDGITVTYADWWFNLRASNTEPVAKLVIEASSQATLDARCAQVLRGLGADEESPRGGKTAQPGTLVDPICKVPVDEKTAPARTRFEDLT